MTAPRVHTPHEAGRELDALVAEKVMGLTGIQPISVLDHKGWHSEPGTVSEPYTMTDGRQGVRATQLPHYSTDIAAAWEVVEKLTSWVAVGKVVNHPQWYCDISEFDERGELGGKGTRALGLSAPHAICLAALKAVGA